MEDSCLVAGAGKYASPRRRDDKWRRRVGRRLGLGEASEEIYLCMVRSVGSHRAFAALATWIVGFWRDAATRLDWFAIKVMNHFLAGHG